MPLDLLHIELMGPMRTKSKYGKKYVLVVVDDFSMHAFISFLREKYETIEHLKVLCTRLQVEKGHSMVRVRSDRRREFDNVEFDHFYESKGIKYECSTSRTPNKMEWLKARTVFFKKWPK